MSAVKASGRLLCSLKALTSVSNSCCCILFTLIGKGRILYHYFLIILGWSHHKFCYYTLHTMFTSRNELERKPNAKL
ncbi:hypothetical protein VIBNISOn1_1010005 [Vibrio nigripulchritudo SOn1]|uniref:Secreted protein n=1 Tax=Vibrio nigripulchritudo SOn1 TaxID=1238450 RepID=A0AAV2VI37_9VIBR|nr:hypothetical protein VIBNISOn1_1010005 [Vibrio nigripulchritudo SOn1]